MRLKREQLEGFEADEIAPPMPTRSKPKKKVNKKSKKLSSKKKQSQNEKTSTDENLDKPEEVETPINAHIWGKGNSTK